ncbi:MAG: threonine synthase [Actinobacteria bacterium]|nr:threonine synthase [Actinomycetota bacterium]
MSLERALRCRECGREYPLAPTHICEYCFGPLEVVYDAAAQRRRVTREGVAAGPPNLWRYIDLLPVSPERLVDLGAGFTPLVKASNLGRELGLPELYIKNDSVNPTFSFKDRVVSVAVTKAIEFGFDTVACASTGNLAASLAAFAARAGLKCYIFIPADLEKAKVVGTGVYGPNLIAVDGNYDQVNRLSTEVADRHGWGFVNINLRPFYAEGSKTLAYETAEQLGWRAPDHIVVPIAGGSVISKIHKGFAELTALGLIPGRETRVSGAQARGCAPVVNAFKKGADVIEPVKPNTIAKSLAIGNPADGYFALDAIRNSGGHAEYVTDEEIVEGIELLARTEGIFTETAGGVTVGVLKKLALSGRISPDELTVAYITGNGLKTIEAVESRGRRIPRVEANLAAFEAFLGEPGEDAAG